MLRSEEPVLAGPSLLLDSPEFIQVGGKAVPRGRQWLWPHEARFLLRGSDGGVQIDPEEEAEVLSGDRSRIELEPFVRLLQERAGESRVFLTANTLLAHIVAGRLVLSAEEAELLDHASAIGLAIRPADDT